MPLLPRTKNFKSPLNVLNNVKAKINGDKAGTDKTNTISKVERKQYENLDDELVSINLKNNHKSNLSSRMNEPAIKEEYKQFLNELSQSSGSKSSQICPTPLDEILSWPSYITEKKGKSGNKKVLTLDSIETEKFDFMKNFKNTKKGSKKNISKPLITERGDGKGKNKKVNEIHKEISNHIEKKGKTSTKEEQKVSSNISKNIKEEMSIYTRMKMIQESRNVGLYVLCDKCDKARYLPDVKDPLELPEKWYCHMNPDGQHNDCSDPEEILEDEEFLVEKLYNAGSIVWGKVDGYPWWPAMVEDDPDVEEHFWLEENCPTPTYYHVTFFDTNKVTRAWLRPEAILPFMANKNNPRYNTSKFSKFYARIKVAKDQAINAANLPLIDRLRKYSFIERCYKPSEFLDKKQKKSPQKRNKEQKKNGKGENKDSKKAIKNTKTVKKNNKKGIEHTEGAIKDSQEIMMNSKESMDDKKAMKENDDSSGIGRVAKRKKTDLENPERKKFRRICTISSMSDSSDNISVILGEINWQNADSLEIDFLNDL